MIIIAFESILLVVCVALQVFMRDVNTKKKKKKEKILQKDTNVIFHYI